MNHYVVYLKLIYVGYISIKNLKTEKMGKKTLILWCSVSTGVKEKIIHQLYNMATGESTENEGE